jgi:hypothetical protein
LRGSVTRREVGHVMVVEEVEVGGSRLSGGRERDV